MKIINKSANNSWVAFDRTLMRDTRIKSNTKVLYLLFKSLSQSCDDIYISYSYIAREIGYVYNGVHPEGSESMERAMRKFVLTNLEPLIKLGWIRKTNQVGESCDWEVYNADIHPEQKSSGTLNKKVQGNPEQKSSSSYKRVELKERVRSTSPAFPKLSTLDKATHEEVFALVNELFPELIATPFLRFIVEILIKIPDWHEYAKYVQKNKLGRYMEINGWKKWFYQDYLVDKHRVKDPKTTLTLEEQKQMIELGEKYGYDFSEPEENKDKMTFDDYLFEAKIAKIYKTEGFTPHSSVAHLWDTLEVEELDHTFV